MWYLLLALSVWPGAAAAKSTVVARLAAPAIAGPGLPQKIDLYLHYFPGDGEAVRGVEVVPEAPVLSVEGGTSALGEAAAEGWRLRVEYGDGPLGHEAIDTVQVWLRSIRRGEASLEVRLYSSAEEAVAHRVQLTLEIAPPLGAVVSVEPTRLFPGQRTEVRIEVRNQDEGGRTIESVRWEWPAGLAAGDACPLSSPVPSGQTATVRVPVTVATGVDPGNHVLGGAAAGAGMVGSPLPGGSLTVSPGLEAALEAPGPVVEVGAETTFDYVMRNPGPEALDIDAITVEVPDGFQDVAVAAGGAPGAAADRRLALAGQVRLGPGEEFRASLHAVPMRAGPALWRGWYCLAGHDDPLPAAGRPVLAVALGNSARAGTRGPGAPGPPTDVGAVTEALRLALVEAVASLPADRGQAIRLVADDATQKKNWVVEDALAAVLMDAGHRLRLDGEEKSAGPSAARLHYRLLSSKAVYTPRRGGWNPFISGQERQAVASVLLRLVEPGGQVTWARRVRSSSTDAVSGGAAEWLGGGQGVDRVEVPADFRALEMGLSGLIVGGLMFVFFIP